MQVKRESKLERALAAADKTIAGLKQKIIKLKKTVASLTKQLDEYRSIRRQLDRGKLQSENTELRKQYNIFKSIIEQHGIGHLLRRNKNQRLERDALKNIGRICVNADLAYSLLGCYQWKKFAEKDTQVLCHVLYFFLGWCL